MHGYYIRCIQKIDFEAASSQSVKSLKCQMCNMDFGMEKENFYSNLAYKVCQQAGMGNAGLDEENKFPCDLCEKSYVEKSSLMKHIRWKHKSPSPKLQPLYCYFQLQTNTCQAPEDNSWHYE